MPLLVPGSGTGLDVVLRRNDLVVSSGEEPPINVPYVPAEYVFDRSNRKYYQMDIGGPIAYVFFGALIRPESDGYRNQLVLQLSGGPTGGIVTTNNVYSADDLDGTAIDAFWPSGRPLMKSKK
jgi:hypothetical protein